MQAKFGRENKLKILCLRALFVASSPRIARIPHIRMANQKSGAPEICQKIGKRGAGHETGTLRKAAAQCTAVLRPGMP